MLRHKGARCSRLEGFLVTLTPSSGSAAPLFLKIQLYQQQQVVCMHL
ncbi:unnamed protein product [Amoebophrya sp. A120]|nr:unnamed protein product [Amoebophrya sp. A120]|eukprot:GSA120T00026330001.1